jgi:Mg/Co/Ni transporter MgtE
MLNLTPLAPVEASDVTVHIVLNDFGDLGRAYVETDEAEADQATIVDNILTGQYSHPLRVVAFNTAEGWARDVTEDVAHAVLDRARREDRSIGNGAQEFLERTLGEAAQAHYHF